MRTPYLIAFILLIGTVAAQERFRFCATSSISENTCIALQRGESQVSCVRVEDSSECAIRINRGEADFGVFTAEEALLAYQFYPADTRVIAQLKNKERTTEPFEFKTVAVVSSNYTAGNFSDLLNGGFCHPGFSQTQLWNDYILKYFERKVINTTCDSTLTSAENEAVNLKNYFGTACRPGNWVAEPSQDAALKQKYPELCAACDNTTSCRYSNTDNHGHTGALDCLVAGRGKVAYAALTNVYQYFNINSSVLASTPTAETLGPLVSQYKFLCADGLLDSLYSANPCSWVKQPWGIIAARTESAASLQTNLKTWLTVDPAVEVSQSWTVALNSILQRENVLEYSSDLQNLATYLATGRDLTVSAPVCGDTIRWCTVSAEETNKCNWISKAAVTHGIQPNISCSQANSTFHCFHNIANNTADIITIDSNYGHLARQVYNLSTVLYAETETDRNSVVIAVVRNGTTYNVTSFDTIKSRGVCFPEYGGIAWLSFVNAARQNKVITDSCDYPTEVSNLVSAACTPGYADRDHHNATSGSTSSNLCSLCPIESNNASCSANTSNIYFGDRGALECLTSGAGDVAFIEAKNLLEYVNSGVIDQSKYRVLCRNGTLANYTGFVVDEQCALSVTIDSEVMGRSSRSEVNSTNTVLALLKIENWLGYRTDVIRPIHVYGPFNNTRNLLFKDSTSGLETTSSTLRAVLAYKELFAHVESCNSGSIAALASLSTILLMLFVHYL